MKTDEIKYSISVFRKKIIKFIKGFNNRNSFALLIYLLVFLLVNYIIAANILGGQEFFVKWAASKNLFFQGINPYSQNSFNIITQKSKSILVIPSKADFHFLNPIYSLVLFLPFALISNFIVARTLWLIINEILLFFSVQIILRILEWKLNLSQKRIFLIFGLFFVYSIIVLLQGSEHIILFFFFLLSLETAKNHNFIGAGIFLSLLTINPLMMLLPILTLLLFLLKNKGWVGVIWFLISLSLFIIGLLILQPDWPLQFLREIIINAPLSGLSIPGKVIIQLFNNPISSVLWNLLALFAIGLTIYEIFFMKMLNCSPVWMVGLILTINPLVVIQQNLGYMCFLLFPFGLIFQQWDRKNIIFGKRVIQIAIIVFSIFLPIFGLLTKSILNETILPVFFYLFPVGFVLLNLYWIRGWVVNEIGIN